MSLPATPVPTCSLTDSLISRATIYPAVQRYALRSLLIARVGKFEVSSLASRLAIASDPGSDVVDCPIASRFRGRRWG
jgi:hypothetical protein